MSDMQKDEGVAVSQSFLKGLTSVQLDLLIYITSLLGHTRDAEDVLQETNLALCRKASEYDVSRPFIAWAKTFAKYEVLKYRTLSGRERVVFNEEVFEHVASCLSEDAASEGANASVIALRGCFAKLTHSQQTAMREKYFEACSLRVMAQRRGCSEAAIGMLLYRIRQVLAECVCGVLQQSGDAAS